ncbi:MAG: response regulator [Pelagimonas sp.]
MSFVSNDASDDRVSRKRYLRERRAREEAEALLEEKSRVLFDANQELKQQATELERVVRERTEELERAKTAAEEANEAKTSFLAMISHEIRTPLNGVLGMASALSETEMDEGQDAMVDLILSSGQGLLTMLNDLLDLTKIEAQQMDLESISFDLPKLIREVFQLFSVTVSDKGLRFDLDLGPGAQGRVKGDPTRIRQVLSNLMSNAVKFTETGGVSLAASVEDGFLTLEVTDTGIGVPEEKRDKLFKPFSQTDSSVSRTHGGTGLGLVLSQRICRMMGGDLSYSPGDGRGSVFTATVQIAATEEPDQVPQDPAFDADAYLTKKTWRILAAEDNETNRKVLELLLKRYEFDLEILEDGAQLVRRFQDAPSDLVLLDVNMPVLTGPEAAARLRVFERASRRSPVPIIALSANAMTHQVQQYLRQGIDAHVAKPVSREDLAAEMARLLRRVHGD